MAPRTAGLLCSLVDVKQTVVWTISSGTWRSMRHALSVSVKCFRAKMDGGGRVTAAQAAFHLCPGHIKPSDRIAGATTATTTATTAAATCPFLFS
ncbi:unnamed protein product [Lota lota]